MTDYLDALIDEAVIHGELAAGASPAWLSRHSDPRLVAIMAGNHNKTAEHAQEWQPDEDAFLRRNLGWLSEQEIADHLGRTINAVRIRWKRDLRLPAPSKHPDRLTGHKAAQLLHVDVKCITHLMRLGILPGRILPGKRGIHLIDRRRLLRWAVNPEHWVYFKPHRVTDPHLRRLLQLKQQRWNDEWWTIGQVAAYHGTHHTNVNNYIHAGKIPAVDWGNWWIKRSDATNPNLRFYNGKGAAEYLYWDPATDAFLLLARGVGISLRAIEKLCVWPHNRAEYRLRLLRRAGTIPNIIQRHQLAVHYNADSGYLWADWRLYCTRFPALTTAVDRFISGHRINVHQVRMIAGILWSWGQWHARTPQQQKLAYKKRFYSGVASAGAVRAYYEELLSWGIDPLGGQS